ncbi:hypothetical protein AFLA_003717 [Aspergillus flavus NRRL3357]|nr:hypothetical protein AFLA_003717 [Aspergillus flavus NRRL3357]
MRKHYAGCIGKKVIARSTRCELIELLGQSRILPFGSLQCPELSQRRSRTDKLSISACFGRGFQALQLSFKSQMV